jgi:hypothetical protein
MEGKSHNITWLQTTNQTEIMPQYQSLDSRERGKLRLDVDVPTHYRACSARRQPVDVVYQVDLFPAAPQKVSQ